MHVTKALQSIPGLQRLVDYGVRHTNLTARQKHSGHKIPLIGGFGTENLIGDREYPVERIIARLLGLRGGAFIDVGANIGQTLLKVKSADPARPYLGFDVQAACIFYLQRLIEANTFENCSVIPVGLGLRDGVFPLLFNWEADVSATIDPNFRATEFYSRSAFGVIRNGDEALLEIGVKDVAVVKADVEGGEADVIEGLAQTISVQRPFIVCEVLPTVHLTDARIVAHRRDGMARLLKFASERSYVIFRIGPDGAVQPVENFDLQEYRQDLCNYLFAPAEQKQHFSAYGEIATL